RYYDCDLRHGHSMTVAADTSGSVPVTYPLPVRYTASGFYTPLLTLFTAENLTTQIHNGTSNITITNTDTINTYSITVGTTIAAGNLDLAKTPPNVITEIVNSPGGPFSFDPQIDYETVGFEVVVNTQATLLFYNANSTTVWFPYLASEVPSVSNGEITGSNTTYTLHLRPDVAFSNRGRITAYDVWYSTIRSMLFQGGEPGTAPRIISQSLIPMTAPPS